MFPLDACVRREFQNVSLLSNVYSGEAKLCYAILSILGLCRTSDRRER